MPEENASRFNFYFFRLKPKRESYLHSKHAYWADFLGVSYSHSWILLINAKGIWRAWKDGHGSYFLFTYGLVYNRSVVGAVVLMTIISSTLVFVAIFLFVLLLLLLGYDNLYICYCCTRPCFLLSFVFVRHSGVVKVLRIAVFVTHHTALVI